MIGNFKSYFQEHYRVYHGSADLYAYFIEKGVSLLNPAGFFSYIVANKWMRANYGLPLRKWLKQQCLNEIIDFGDLPVFKGATTYPCIIRICKGKPPEHFSAVVAATLHFESLDTYVRSCRQTIQLSALEDSGWSLTGEKVQELLKKVRVSGIPLRDYVKGKILYGIKTGLNEAFVIDSATRDRLTAEDPMSAELIKPFLAGRDIKRCHPLPAGKFLIFTRRGTDIQKYPAIEKHLQQFKEMLMPKPAGWKGTDWKGRKPGQYKWYEIQDAIDYFAEFEKPKIIVPAIVQKASYTFDHDGFLSNDKTTIIAVDDLYLLGMLNSKVCDFVMHSIASTKQGGYYEYKPMYLSQLPIRPINFSDPADKARQVEQMLSLHKKLAAANTDHEKTNLQRQIDAADSQIDRLVYELYELTEEEIKIVEDSK